MEGNGGFIRTSCFTLEHLSKDSSGEFRSYCLPDFINSTKAGYMGLLSTSRHFTLCRGLLVTRWWAHKLTCFSVQESQGEISQALFSLEINCLNGTMGANQVQDAGRFREKLLTVVATGARKLHGRASIEHSNSEIWWLCVTSSSSIQRAAPWLCSSRSGSMDWWWFNVEHKNTHFCNHSVWICY